MDGFFQVPKFKVYAFISVMTFGASSGIHDSQDFSRLFQNNEARFVYTKVLQALPEADKSLALGISRAIMTEAKMRAFDPVFLVAIIQQESHFKSRMIGSVGEIGLMQIRPETAQWVAKRFQIPFENRRELLNPEMNIKMGTAYLGYLKDRYGSVKRIFVPTYNMGIRGFHQSCLRGDQPTQYLNGVEAKYRRLKREYSRPTLAMI